MPTPGPILGALRTHLQRKTPLRANERQLDPRTKRRVLAKFGVDTPAKTAFTMNLSRSGAFLRTNDVFRPGTTIQVRFDFKEGEQHLWAQVIWAKKVPPQLAHVLHCGMGVRFVNPGPDWESFFTAWKEAIEGKK